MEIISPSFQILAMTGHPELPYQYQPNPKLSEYFVWTTTEEEMERVKAKYK
jgi:hypothetical protein